eukprot:763192-Hanusia_phi.AAC.3
MLVCAKEHREFRRRVGGFTSNCRCIFHTHLPRLLSKKRLDAGFAVCNTNAEDNASKEVLKRAFNHHEEGFICNLNVSISNR